MKISPKHIVINLAEQSTTLYDALRSLNKYPDRRAGIIEELNNNIENIELVFESKNGPRISSLDKKSFLENMGDKIIVADDRGDKISLRDLLEYPQLIPVDKLDKALNDMAFVTGRDEISVPEDLVPPIVKKEMNAAVEAQPEQLSTLDLMADKVMEEAKKDPKNVTFRLKPTRIFAKQEEITLQDMIDKIDSGDLKLADAINIMDKNVEKVIINGQTQEKMKFKDFVDQFGMDYRINKASLKFVLTNDAAETEFQQSRIDQIGAELAAAMKDQSPEINVETPSEPELEADLDPGLYYIDKDGKTREIDDDDIVYQIDKLIETGRIYSVDEEEEISQVSLSDFFLDIAPNYDGELLDDNLAFSMLNKQAFIDQMKEQYRDGSYNIADEIMQRYNQACDQEDQSKMELYEQIWSEVQDKVFSIDKEKVLKIPETDKEFIIDREEMQKGFVKHLTNANENNTGVKIGPQQMKILLQKDNDQELTNEKFNQYASLSVKRGVESIEGITADLMQVAPVMAINENTNENSQSALLYILIQILEFLSKNIGIKFGNALDKYLNEEEPEHTKFVEDVLQQDVSQAFDYLSETLVEGMNDLKTIDLEISNLKTLDISKDMGPRGM